MPVQSVDLRLAARTALKASAGAALVAAALVAAVSGTAQAAPTAAPPTTASPTAAPSVGAPPTAAVFDFQLANLGQLPPTAADKARLPHLSDMLRDLLAKSGKYKIVSTAPVRAKAQSEDLRSCGGCADDYAKKVGAQLAITGEIQKVSNLILNINVYIKDVDTSTPEHAYSVDIRGDNDLSFDHGIKYIVKHNILGE